MLDCLLLDSVFVAESRSWRRGGATRSVVVLSTGSRQADQCHSGGTAMGSCFLCTLVHIEQFSGGPVRAPAALCAFPFCFRFQRVRSFLATTSWVWVREESLPYPSWQWANPPHLNLPPVPSLTPPPSSSRQPSGLTDGRTDRLTDWIPFSFPSAFPCEETPPQPVYGFPCLSICYTPLPM